MSKTSLEQLNELISEVEQFGIKSINKKTIAKYRPKLFVNTEEPINDQLAEEVFKEIDEILRKFFTINTIA